jgi:hypothetical protein
MECTRMTMRFSIRLVIRAATTLTLFILLVQSFFVEEVLALFLIGLLLSFVVDGSIILTKVALGKKASLRDLWKPGASSAIVGDLAMIIAIGYVSLPRYSSKVDVASDLDTMVQMLERVHPNPYHSLTSDEFRSAVETCKGKLPERVSNVEFKKMVARLLAKTGDAHTRFAFTHGMSPSILFSTAFPYRIRIVNDRIFVVGNYGYRSTIPCGSEILSINGFDANQIRAEVSQYASIENEDGRTYATQNPLLIGLWNSFGDYQITYRSFLDGHTRGIRASGGFVSQVSYLFELGAFFPPYEFEIIDSAVGYLGFHSCRNLPKFRLLLENAFGTMKDSGIGDLIIDVRRNGGGNSLVATELLQFIAKQSVQESDSSLVKISKEAERAEKFDWLAPEDRVNGSVHWMKGKRMKLRDNPLRFSGNCYLLVGSGTFSSASGFAAAFKCNRIGKIIGSETGGLAVAYGDIVHLKLPRTGLPIAVSCKKFYHACGADDRRGVIPHVTVYASPEAECAGVDPVMECALGIIRDQRQTSMTSVPSDSLQP